MAKTANINLRIDPVKKQQAESLFSSFGISVTDAINIFLHASIMEGGFPFQIKQPRYNKETELAMEEARQIALGNIQTKSYSSVEELLIDLNNEEN
ncbi:type II toxin-antitoxin system RelB/DinJ family antitoxin [Aerococcaceae bacterium zg-ZJ1578]|uniref:type II toxin-antitoxin system RelB/DinJ family antitoxin n=1 Tax=Aerococcaceae TaxID=186827 RepID=UPI0013BC873E|nr:MULTISPECIES: type II toxin-antitoxin system RelB/DinJ family antitoxin [unclassified Facklamia]MBK0348587.1 type II toxin-antitoxin system RelB/DinJ family antitoxin [Aerococcaceae bacterium zg-1578]MBR7927131.1 type II toxin-antitoxin system RelB/DinJ family antitoxin [Aerococcaceae bacterium zg-ZUI334]MBS4461925.1 type II toxin-antitoxin system RelB/DinJ family antitoxin [Aerococcaceae bacterium zg-B36]QQD66439.1 type II toxin-antitoxin system RelB/DinJ family antitoxin [Aerococcaceae bac